MNDLNQTPAGWYGDPSGADRQRFWDGQQWTDQYAKRTAETATPSGTRGMAFTKKTAAIWGAFGAFCYLVGSSTEEGTSLPPEIGMPFIFAVVFGIVMFLGWVIGRVRVLLSGNKPSAALATSTASQPVPKLDDERAVSAEVKGAEARAEVAESLRRLKALHDDGILTNDEYETKRKALTNEL
jgi:hypothetical protein